MNCAARFIVSEGLDDTFGSAARDRGAWRALTALAFDVGALEESGPSRSLRICKLDPVPFDGCLIIESISCASGGAMLYERVRSGPRGAAGFETSDANTAVVT